VCAHLPHPAQFWTLTHPFVTKPVELLSSTTFYICLNNHLTIDQYMPKSSILYAFILVFIYLCLNFSFVSSFLKKTTTTPQNTRSVVVPYTISNVLPDMMITVGLCVLLRNRRSEVQVSRYAPILSFRLKGRSFDQSFFHDSMNRIIQNIIIFSVERFILSLSGPLL
jgi:hypothetical protein